jgi:hypothetical protein
MTNLLHNLLTVILAIILSPPGMIFLGIAGICAIYMGVEIHHSEVHPGDCVCSWCIDDRTRR